MKRLVLAGPLLLLLVTVAQADPPGPGLRDFPHAALLSGVEFIGQDDHEPFVTRREIDQRLQSLAEAIVVATAALDKRLDGMNEFRQALEDQRRDTIDRITKIETIIAQIPRNTTELDKLTSAVAILNTAGSPFAISQIEQLRREIEFVRTLAQSLDTGGGTIAKQAARDIAELKIVDTTLATRLAAIEVAASTSVQLWELIAAIIGVIGIVYGIVHYGGSSARRGKTS